MVVGQSIMRCLITEILCWFVSINQVFEDTGMLLRGLAHPTALQACARLLDIGAVTVRLSPKSTASSSPDPSQGSDATGGSQFGSFLATYGAVTVSGKNIFSLLQQGEAVLLYPGGVREAYKGRGEQYQLFWPEKSEFVRMAAKFDATIVPFSGGCCMRVLSRVEQVAVNGMN